MSGVTRWIARFATQTNLKLVSRMLMWRHADNDYEYTNDFLGVAWHALFGWLVSHWLAAQMDANHG